MICDGLILDIDGTVWNTTGIVAQAWNDAIEKEFPEVPRVSAKILKGQFGKTMKVISDNLFGCLSEENRKKLIDICAEYEQAALDSINTDLTYPGVIDTISQLAKKLPLFVVSNCQSGYIELVLAKNGITNLIKDFVCFGDNGKEKWENIQIICKRNNLNHPVYVGDTQGDADSCCKAGVKFIYASYGFGQVKSYDAKIDTFSQITKYIDLYNK